MKRIILILLKIIREQLNAATAQIFAPLSRQKSKLFAEKLLDLANYAAAGIVFTQFVLQSPRIPIIILGLTIWLLVFLAVKVYLKE